MQLETNSIVTFQLQPGLFSSPIYAGKESCVLVTLHLANHTYNMEPKITIHINFFSNIVDKRT